jgi:hypothetical protein
MNCKQLVEMVTDYLENRLPVEERVRFEQHVIWCDWCDEYLLQTKRTISLTGALAGALDRPAPDPEATEKLRGLFRKWKGE